MSWTWKFVVISLVIVGAWAAYMYATTSPQTPVTQPRERKPGEIYVGMPACSVGFANIGSVSRIVRDANEAITAVEITTSGPVTWGTRSIDKKDAWVSHRCLQINLHRHQFRALPRIDKKKR